MIKMEKMSPDLTIERISPSMKMELVPADVTLHGNLETSCMMSSSSHQQCSITQEEPRDLSIKRKMRPVPPPLDLSKRTLEPEQLGALIISPKSPSAQKNLPLRKRAYSWSSQPENLGLQLPPDSGGVIRTSIDERCSYESFPSTSSLKMHGLPTPQTPHTPHPHSAIPVITSRFNFGEGCSASGMNTLGNGCLGTNNQGPLNLSTSSMSALPSSLLSPAPSHPSSSSLNSSREELEPEYMNSDYQISSLHNSPHPVSSQSHLSTNGTNMEYCLVNATGNQNVYNGPEQQSGGRVNSPMNGIGLSPGLSNSHQWPTTVWSVFLAGAQVHFVLGNGQVTPARLSEELAQLDRSQKSPFAPHGLILARIINDGSKQHGAQNSYPLYCQLYFRPAVIQQQDVIVVIPCGHPFYVHGKGWCSMYPDRASDHYDLPCQALQEGDLCLPPYHPETTGTPIPVVTPDLTDAMKRFDFNDDGYESSTGGTYSAPTSATFVTQNCHRSVFLSPPTSPSKKTSRGSMVINPMVSTGTTSGIVEGLSVPKSRRPMNGFMLFAKQHRLKLIQQYPGKDNRAISVLLGAMWKSLPEEDRDRFNAEARIQAEERKRIDPDCWKRKRSHSTS